MLSSRKLLLHRDEVLSSIATSTGLHPHNAELGASKDGQEVVYEFSRLGSTETPLPRETLRPRMAVGWTPAAGRRAVAQA